MFLQRKIDSVMDEARSLILVSQIALGFQYRSGFEPGTQRLPALFGGLTLTSMGMMLVALGFLALPAIYQRLALRGESGHELDRVATRSVGTALIPFALSLGLNLAVGVASVLGPALGILLGAVAGSIALVSWCGLGAVGDSASGIPAVSRFSRIAIGPAAEFPTELDHKLRDALADIRLLLPGAQALLGFQISVALMPGFETLPPGARAVYVLSLGLIAAATILLVTPTAYHRLVERGGSTPRFHRLAGRMLIAAMAALATALSGDVLVAVQKVTGDLTAAATAAGLTCVFFFVLWFAVPLLQRRTARRREIRFERGGVWRH